MSKPTNAQRALAHVQRLQEAGVKGIHDSEGLTAFPLEDREHGGAPDHHVLVDNETALSSLAVWGCRFNAFLGLRTLLLTKEVAVLEVELRPDLQQQLGNSHLGTMLSLGDACCGALGNYLVSSQTITLVSTSSTGHVLRPGKERLVAVASVVKRGRRLSVMSCDIFSVVTQANSGTWKAKLAHRMTVEGMSVPISKPSAAQL